MPATELVVRSGSRKRMDHVDADGPRKARLCTLITICLTAVTGCGGGGNGGNGSPSSGVNTPAADPLFVECTSTVAIDAHDPKQPVITLTGPAVINQAIGSSYVDAGAFAIDPAEGDISPQIQVSGLNTLNANVAGDYLVRYNVQNSARLAAAEVVRVVRVNAGSGASFTARDIGTTRGHMGYYEHLPVNYGDDPDQKYPLIIYQHGWFHARFLNPHTVQVPLSTIEDGNIVQIYKSGSWDNSLPFIVLSPQRCLDALEPAITAAQTKRFIDYAINTYKVDPTRIYMGGHSQGSGDTWDYVANYPKQLAAIFPISGGYGSAIGCTLKETPAWAFIGREDATVPYLNQVTTVNSINDCNPLERARITVFPGISHNDIEMPVLGLTSLGQGLIQYDLYDESIYDWLLQHSRQ
ncbi:MAG: immunoglobulin-like domain-containing protein [Povalibacter sp.]